MKTVTKCHKTMGEVAKEHMRRVCHRRTKVDKKLNTFKQTQNIAS